ncbi:hypothetical protein RYX36_000699, partial [Vicia faba]
FNDINMVPLSEDHNNLQQSLSGGCSHTTSSTMSNSLGDVVTNFEKPTKTLKHTNPSNIGEAYGKV